MASTETLRSSEQLWKHGGYYQTTPEELRQRPALPNLELLPERRFLELLRTHAQLTSDVRVLEMGCGGSPWLPFLARQYGCKVEGLDNEPFAAELARANLAGAGVQGRIYCRDAFAVEENHDLFQRYDLVYSRGLLEHFPNAATCLKAARRFLKPRGILVTTVPNLRGINWAMQQLASRERYLMHVVYDSRRLQVVHEQAGFATISAGYLGYFDPYMTSVAESTTPRRQRLHARLCRIAGLISHGWVSTTGGTLAPELGWLAPHVFYTGRYAEVM